MSEFEHSNTESDEDDTEVFTIKDVPNMTKLSRELNLRYSQIFIDSFELIDLFVKDKRFTYHSFLEHFENNEFHRIYMKQAQKNLRQMHVHPHHYISVTQDALVVASKFLRSRSKKARIGAVYLLYTLYKTQPLKRYIMNISMTPEDYNRTKDLVDSCLKENIPQPAYCFCELDMRRAITITASTTNPCLEANYPRLKIRKNMGRIADKNFEIEYEERTEIYSLNKVKIMEHQIRNRLSYINKLSNLTLGCDAALEYKIKLSTDFEQILNSKDQKPAENNTSVEKPLKQNNPKKFVVFPGKNDHLLQDLVTTQEVTHCSASTDSDNSCSEKLPKKKKRKIGSYQNNAVLETSSENAKLSMPVEQRTLVPIIGVETVELSDSEKDNDI